VFNLCDFYYEWIVHISSEMSENIKSRTNLGHVPEIKDCPGKEQDGWYVTLCSCVMSGSTGVRTANW